MTRRILLTALLVTALTLQAQEKGNWRASSKNAKSLTGDVAFSGQKVSIALVPFTVAQIRTLTPAEIAATFDADASLPAAGNLYRTDIPAGRKFLHGNTLCGGEDTEWIVTYVSGRTLQLAFFSTIQMPVLTPEALTNSSNLCGIYTYTR
jgi:hypothetical protein